MGPLHNPSFWRMLLFLFLDFFLPRVRMWGIQPSSRSKDLTSSKSYPLSKHILRVLCGFAIPSGSSVSRSILKSFLFAPATGQESGIPFLSVVRLRFVPILALSVGFFPVFFPAERGFCHCPVGTAKAPVNPFDLIVFSKGMFPYLPEYSLLHPFLKSSMR